MDARPSLARAGEDLAAELYVREGFEILDRNYRCREGELDLIAADRTTIVFCEVKTRRDERWGGPFEAVGALKQARIRRLAVRWMGEHQLGRRTVRFDVVSVIVRGPRPEVTRIVDAF